MNCFDYDENLIKITEYNVLGKLPDPFLMNNGKTVTTKEDWEERKKEIYKTAVELQYGTQPPKPEFFSIDKIYENSSSMCYRIHAGTKEKQVQFIMKIIMPDDLSEKPKAVVDGDLCFNYAFNTNYLDCFKKNGFAYVLFNRCELANDIMFEGRRHGPLYDVYPEYSFGAIGAWAWGYSRCVDALEKLSVFDLSALAFTGHSRGGKTAMLAGVLDERAKIVNPNETNAGSCSCYRIHSKIICEDGEERRSERLSDLWNNFGYWIGEGMGEYADRENELPFDCHFLKAMIAPRVLLVGEAASDAWTNVVGTWQTSIAATEVFKFLGYEENLIWYFRKGYHSHNPEDAIMLVNVINHVHDNEKLNDNFFKTPFKKPEKIFDWVAPKK